MSDIFFDAIEHFLLVDAFGPRQQAQRHGVAFMRAAWVWMQGGLGHLTLPVLDFGHSAGFDASRLLADCPCFDQEDHPERRRFMTMVNELQGFNDRREARLLMDWLGGVKRDYALGMVIPLSAGQHEDWVRACLGEERWAAFQEGFLKRHFDAAADTIAGLPRVRL
jgi:hypothetical protein